MENKRKIWVRVAAFMAAIICCVLCVVPAYAEEGETTEQDLKDEIARQAGVLEALAGRSMDIAIDPQLSTRLAEYGKTYDDVTFYGHIASDMVALGSAIYHTSEDASAQGFVRLVVRDSGGGMVENVVYQITKYSSYNHSDLGYNLLTMTLAKNSSADSLPSISVYSDFTTGEGLRVYYRQNSSKKTSYYVTDGYSYSLNILSWGRVADVVGYQEASYTFINPSALLSLDVSAGNDEVYNQGYQHGYEIGFGDGEEYGYEGGLVLGREEGYTEGEADGYRTGYDDGMHQTSLIDGIKSLFRAPMEFVENALNFEIFGIDLGEAVKALVSMMLLALVVTIVWKAVK